jgi:hypothetical protein
LADFSLAKRLERKARPERKRAKKVKFKKGFDFFKAPNPWCFLAAD